MATKLKYNRVRNNDQKEDKPETDIIMRSSSSYGRYITRALKLFFGEGKSFVRVIAADRLIDRALWVAEVIKRRVEGLHQVIQITEKEIIDVYEPKEEGLLRVEQKRFLTVVEVTLTKEPTANQKKAAGYQGPLTLKDNQYLNKDKWEKQEVEREEKMQARKQRAEKGQKGEKRERKQYRRNERGQERRRGRRNQ